MKKYLILGAGLPCLMFAVAAHAQTDGDPSQTNVQINLSHEYANVNTTVSNVQGSVSNTAAAIGNSYSVTGSDSNSWAGDINNSQANTQGVFATLTAESDNVAKNVSDTAAAIGNSFSANVANTGTVENYQYQSQYDPYATVNQTTSQVAGTVTGTAAAIGNSASVTGAYAYDLTGITNTQIAAAPESAVANVAISGNDVTTQVSETAAAIGNSASLQGTIGTVNSYQANYGNITAAVNYNQASNNIEGIQSVNGDVAVTAAAIGNSLSITGSLADPMNSYQLNQNGYESASITGNIATVSGSVTQTAAAIGNSVSVTVK